ncbi:MAG TPA: DUF3842 family protein [Nitrospira sp.]|jgi:hypothetical protein
MRVCVIDGRGGGLGKRLIQKLRLHVDARDEIIALGTNDAATKAMRLAGASVTGTGEQRIKQALPTVDVILAPLNLVLPGSLLGEVTPAIAGAILSAQARKLLLPISHPELHVVGVEALTLEHLIALTVDSVQALRRRSLPA